MRGRKPVPRHLKLVTGNRGKRALNPREAIPESAIPEAPAFLSVEAQAEWIRVCDRLGVVGLLTELDRAALAAYCQAYGRWEQAERAIALIAAQDPITMGLMIRTTNGNAVQNPLVGTANKAAADMVRYAAEFGMTPSARSRIDADKTGATRAQQDPARKYF